MTQRTCFELVPALLLALIVGCGSSDEGGDRPTGGRPPSAPVRGGNTDTLAQPSSSEAIGGGQPDNSFDATGGAGAPTQVEPPPDDGLGDCGMISIAPVITFTPGNLLVIFDRSISMSTAFPDEASGTSRLDNARHAIKTALNPLVCPDSVTPDGPGCTDVINVALLTFPTYDGVNGLDATGAIGGFGFGGGGMDDMVDDMTDPGDMADPGVAAPDAGMVDPGPQGLSCTVDGLETDEQIPWQGVTPFVAAFDPYWDSRALVDGGILYPGTYPLLFGTPISVAFARADEALLDPGIEGNKAVLFLTDGEETGECMGGDVVGLAQQWNAMGILTHVVSLAEPGGMGQSFNDMVAAAGGTERSLYPEDSAALTQEITDIVIENRGSVMCEITIQDAKLTDAMMACEGGRVRVHGLTVPCDQTNRAEGFFVKDEKTFELVGSYCEELQATMDLQADFPCALLTPE